MNRRSLLISGFQAAGAVALAALMRPLAISRDQPFGRRLIAGHAFIHPAIQANIDYWMKVAPDWLADCPPDHTSYYAVKERGHLRVYAVKWNGSNLNDHSVWIPTNEREHVIEVQNQITLTTNQIRRNSPYPDEGTDVGDVMYWADNRPMKICSYVFDSPCRRVKKWQMSNATTLLADDSLIQQRQQDFKI